MIKMARNEEKHFCNLNRLILLKEKEEYEKAHPARPRLSALDTPEDIQKWIPSIKRDIDFYLKKSQVICYSDAHVEECKEKVVKLEKEFKAFVRKIKKLSPTPTDVIPWTSRPYKRKNTSVNEKASFKEFKRIVTPILDDEKTICIPAPNEDNITPFRLDTEENNHHSSLQEDNTLQYDKVNWNFMDQPLVFSAVTANEKKTLETPETNQNDSMGCAQQIERPLFSEKIQPQKTKLTDCINRIVNYDSSDDENS